MVLTETDAGCGPMAAAFLRDYSTSLAVVSAGRNQAETIDPMLVTVMSECLVDLSGYVPRSIESVDVAGFDAVYECPDRPAPDTIEEFRKLRDFIKNEAYLFFRKTNETCVSKVLFEENPHLIIR